MRPIFLLKKIKAIKIEHTEVISGDGRSIAKVEAWVELVRRTPEDENIARNDAPDDGRHKQSAESQLFF